MARQLVENTLEIHLPGYTSKVSGKLNNHEQISIAFTVTPKQQVTISNVRVEGNIQNIPVDIIGQIGTHNFILYFTHPNREVPVELYNPENTQCGIVAISLNKTHTLFLNSKKSSQSYKEILLSFLINDISSKQWVFHPRYESKKEIVREELSKKINAQNLTHRSGDENFSEYSPSEELDSPRLEHPEFQEPERKPAKYECVICHTQWEGLEPRNKKCPECDTHLFSKFLNYV